MLFGLLQQSAPVYSVTVPAETPDVASIIYLAKQTFGEDTIDATTVHNSYRKNPYCGLIVKDAQNNVLGYMDFFLMKPETFDAFLDGKTSENHFESSDILPYGDPAAGNRVYLGGIVVFSDSANERGRIVQILLNGFARLMLAKYVNKDNTMDAYATGFSGQGLALLERLGFERLNDGTQRMDGLPLYRYHMSKSALEHLAQKNVRAERSYRLDIRDV